MAKKRRPTPFSLSFLDIMACGFGACYGCVVPMRLGDDFVYVKSCENGPTFEIRELVARGAGGVSKPVNAFLKGTIPALTNINVGSLYGTSGALATSA